MTFARCDRKIARMLDAMEPGMDYTAADLAKILESSRCEIGALMRSAVADGLIDKVGTAKTGYLNSGKGYVYRVNKDGRQE